MPSEIKSLCSPWRTSIAVARILSWRKKAPTHFYKEREYTAEELEVANKVYKGIVIKP